SIEGPCHRERAQEPAGLKSADHGAAAGKARPGGDHEARRGCAFVACGSDLRIAAFLMPAIHGMHQALVYDSAVRPSRTAYLVSSATVNRLSLLMSWRRCVSTVLTLTLRSRAISLVER